ncbi:hypothetical protein WA026_008649 [Henosepilachna vigintioctopunctata]|uniref:Nucleolar protein 14 n=1 Tax=Henosepilachna vigintioctopunctata TaxID=420089 RepID=A0AAW1UHE6_9CUCU
MAKAKNRKRVFSDKIQDKNKNSKTTMKPRSPFEVHINNEKMKVLGRKIQHSKGLPGISRAKAIDKRKKTLLKEYNVRNKSNSFTDRRICELNQNLSTDEKQRARFAAVRVKAHKKKSIFNLGEDEVLTHKGQTLSEIEKFNDLQTEDEDCDDPNETGKLDEKFVGEAHFGGGLLAKKGEGFKGHKDLIEQLIADSKKRKAEKQKTKESVLELTEKLNSEWKDLIPLVKEYKNNSDSKMEKPKIDDFDRLMNELKFEPRGTVTDRLKSEKELAEEEKEKLEELERQRIERMKGTLEEKPNKITHRSADDLDDDFIYEEIDNEKMLSYNENGVSNVPLESCLTEDKIEDEVSEMEESSHSEVETESEDDLSDLKGESSSSEDEYELEKVKTEQTNNSNMSDVLKENTCSKKKIIKTKDEIPYTFAMPDKYEELYGILIKYTAVNQGTVLERIIQCNHSSLAKGNKDKLGLLFEYSLQYVNNLASESVDEQSLENCFRIFEALMPKIFDLAQMNPNECHKKVVEYLKKKFDEYWENSKQYPGIENLLFLKLISILFTTSDFRHQIITPCLIFIEQMLLNCRVTSKRDISYGLFLSTLALEYSSLSKRFMPGCINYLGGIIGMAISKSTICALKLFPPFKSGSSFLVLLKNQSSNTSALKMEITDLIKTEMTEIFKVRALHLALKLVKEFCDNFDSLASNVEIFNHIQNYCEQVPKDMYPETVQSEINSCLQKFEKMKSMRKLKYLVMEAKKPKALRLYEPKIVEIYDRKNFKIQSEEKAARNKLLHKLKREKKGALREIRRDNAFLGKIKIKQQIQSDLERKQKVKKIYAEASIQQSELNTLDRIKKRKIK